MQKPGLSVNQHKEVADRLFRIYEDLLEVSVVLSWGFPMTGPKGEAYRSIKKATDEISKARSAAEELLFQQHRPDRKKGDEFLRVYYPGSSSKLEALRVDDSTPPDKLKLFEEGRRISSVVDWRIRATRRKG